MAYVRIGIHISIAICVASAFKGSVVVMMSLFNCRFGISLDIADAGRVSRPEHNAVRKFSV